MKDSYDIQEMLPERTSLDDLDSLEKAEEAAFYLYRESATLVAITASVYFGFGDEEFPLTRDQAIASGLLMRTAKFMRVITQLASQREGGDVISALNRCLLESALNLEYLVTSHDEGLFDQYVERSLGPERELYDEIQSNIEKRGGVRLDIEERMFRSIDRVCRASGKQISEIEKKPGQWGGNFRARLKAIGKEDIYLHVQRIGSHAIHGTWVDLALNHLVESDGLGKYRVRSSKRPDARILTPSAILVLDSVLQYVNEYFSGVEGAQPLLEAILNLQERLSRFELLHEGLFQRD